MQHNGSIIKPLISWKLTNLLPWMNAQNEAWLWEKLGEVKQWNKGPKILAYQQLYERGNMAETLDGWIRGDIKA